MLTVAAKATAGGELTFGGARHRHRPDAGGYGAPVPEVSARPTARHAQVRRHGPGPGDQRLAELMGGNDVAESDGPGRPRPSTSPSPRRLPGRRCAQCECEFMAKAAAARAAAAGVDDNPTNRRIPRAADAGWACRHDNWLPTPQRGMPGPTVRRRHPRHAHARHGRPDPARASATPADAAAGAVPARAKDAKPATTPPLRRDAGCCCTRARLRHAGRPVPTVTLAMPRLACQPSPTSHEVALPAAHPVCRGQRREPEVVIAPAVDGYCADVASNGIEAIERCTHSSTTHGQVQQTLGDGRPPRSPAIARWRAPRAPAHRDDRHRDAGRIVVCLRRGMDTTSLPSLRGCLVTALTGNSSPQDELACGLQRHQLRTVPVQAIQPISPRCRHAPSVEVEDSHGPGWPRQALERGLLWLARDDPQPRP